MGSPQNTTPTPQRTPPQTPTPANTSRHDQNHLKASKHQYKRRNIGASVDPCSVGPQVRVELERDFFPGGAEPVPGNAPLSAFVMESAPACNYSSSQQIRKNIQLFGGTILTVHYNKFGITKYTPTCKYNLRYIVKYYKLKKQAFLNSAYSSMRELPRSPCLPRSSRTGTLRAPATVTSCSPT